jgi:hypothetical protein
MFETKICRYVDTSDSYTTTSMLSMGANPTKQEAIRQRLTSLLTSSLKIDDGLVSCTSLERKLWSLAAE